MAITTNASIAQAKTTMLAQSILTNLTFNNVLAEFLKSDSEFASSIGGYQRGQTLSIPVVPQVTTNIVTQTGVPVTYPKQTLTSISLTVDSIASSAFSINEGDVTLANVDPTSKTVTNAAESHGNVIETQMMLDTFNDADIDANQTGASGTKANYDLLTALWESFFVANVPKTTEKIVILPGKQYRELLEDPTVARIANPDQSSTLSDGAILPTLSMKVLPSNACPTLTELTNLTGTGTDGVGFAFTVDSIVSAIRELPTNANGLGVRQVVVRNDDVNIATRLTESYNPNVIGGDTNYHMETLFGTKIYRPTTVFPILGGVA